MAFSHQTWTPKRFKPWQMEILRLYWHGLSRVEVAQRVGCAASTVDRCIDSTDGAAILEELRKGTISTIIETQAEIQAVVPEILSQKIHLALHGANETVRSKSCTELLEMAGHSPVRHISIERPDPLADDYATKSEDDIRRELLDAVKPQRGPDGKLVN